jgi:hypothetical protein
MDNYSFYIDNCENIDFENFSKKIDALHLGSGN